MLPSVDKGTKPGKARASRLAELPRRSQAGEKGAKGAGAELRFEETGVPWLDAMHKEMLAEYKETSRAGAAGTHDAYASPFKPALSGKPHHDVHVPSTSTALVEATPTPDPAKNTALVPLSGSGSRNRLAPVISSGAGQPVPLPYAPTVSLEVAPHAKAGPGAKSQMTLRDYNMLAMACQRGGRGKTEASAYYKMGELYSKDPATLQSAGRCFERYYTLCKHLHDVAGEAKALNCLGIVHQQQGSLEAALQCHRAHLDIAAPSNQFIAHTNIGIIQALLGNHEEALASHKKAMHCTIRSGDKQAELLALANLGLLGQQSKDYMTAQVCPCTRFQHMDRLPMKLSTQICMSRHLELAQVINDPTAQQLACEQLAELHSEKGDWTEAHKYYTDARSLAGLQKSTPMQMNDTLKCKLGVVKATGKMNEYFRDVAAKMGASVSAPT